MSSEEKEDNFNLFQNNLQNRICDSSYETWRHYVHIAPYILSNVTYKHHSYE